MSATFDFTVRAEAIADSFENDAEIRLPERPRLIPELVVVPFGESGLLFDGAVETQVLGGRSARTLLPRLMGRLDGTRTVQQIAAALPGTSAAVVTQVVALLYSRGLVEDGCPEPAAPERADLDGFIGRMFDVTRRNADRLEARRRLENASVRVGGSAEAAAQVLAQLRHCGFGDIAPASSGDDLAGATLLVSVAVGDHDPSPLLDAAQAAGTIALHAHLGSDLFEVGPLFVPGRSCCHHCLRRLYPHAPAGAPPADELVFWLAQVAQTALLFVGGLSDSHLFNVVTRLERTPDGLVHRDGFTTRLPDCPRCGSARAPALDLGSAGALAWLFHNSTGMAPREFLAPRRHQAHYSVANIALTRERAEPFGSAAAIQLPPADALDVPVPWHVRPPGGRLDRAALATLLHHAAGTDPARPGAGRLPPSGGALGSPELFVVARQIDGVPPGIYHYHSPGHLLERLRDVPRALVDAAIGGGNGQAPALILGAGALGRLEHKYGGFAYRIIHLDAGIALQYLRLTAAALGLPTAEPAELHEAAVSELCALPSTGQRMLPTFALEVGLPPPARPLHEIGPDPVEEMVAAVLRGDGRFAARAPAAQSGAVDMAGAWLGPTLRARRSHRVFSDQPVSSDALAALAALVAGVPRERIRDGAPDLGMRAWLALRRDDGGGVAAGVHAVTGGGATVPLGRACALAELERCILQETMAAAPVMMVLAGDFARASSRGARGYRELLVHAGAMAGQALVGATALGLVGCPSGGLMEDGLRRLLGIDGYRECPLLLLALGHPVEKSNA
jgi:SagB-type dehydrogenase family enzyme